MAQDENVIEIKAEIWKIKVIQNVIWVLDKINIPFFKKKGTLNIKVDIKCV